MMSTTTARDAVKILDVLETVKSWVCTDQLQLGMSTRRTHRALRFLQEQKMINSRFEGNGADRYKVYRVYRTDGFPVILLQEEAR